jgi:YesN/AraC family two-component response regulator
MLIQDHDDEAPCRNGDEARAATPGVGQRKRGVGKMGYSVLIIDDEPYAVESLRNIVTRHCPGFSVAACADGGEAGLRLAWERRPDFALVDVRMPLVDGMEVARRLQDGLPGTKAIFVSGYQDFEYARAAMRHGVLDYVLKPVTPADLRKALNAAAAALEGERSQAPGADAGDAPEGGEGGGPPAGGGRARLADARDAIREAIGASLAAGAGMGMGATPGAGAAHDGSAQSPAGERAGYYRRLFESVRGYVDGHYQEPLTLHGVCRRFGVSQPYVSRMFREYADTSFNQYLTRARMRKAKELLASGKGLMIKDVARMVGYDDPFYFSRTFRKAAGRPPKNFKGRRG